jgi:filamentous hemagglutinin
LIGGLAGGNAGVLSSASGVAAGSMGQQMGKTLGEAQADKQGLSGSARDQFVNTYQQTLATLGGTLDGFAAGGQGAMVAVAAAAVDVYTKFLESKATNYAAYWHFCG